MAFTIFICFFFWGGMLILSCNPCRRGRFWWRVGSEIAISIGAPSCWEVGFSSPWVEQSTPTWGLGSFSLDPISTLVLVCLQYFNISKNFFFSFFLCLFLLTLGTSKVLHSLRKTYWNFVLWCLEPFNFLSHKIFDMGKVTWKISSCSSPSYGTLAIETKDQVILIYLEILLYFWRKNGFKNSLVEIRDNDPYSNLMDVVV